MATLKIPTLYSHYTGKQKEIILAGTTIGEVLDSLFIAFPAIKKHLLDSNGGLRRHINIFINKVNIVDLEQQQTPVQDTDVIILLPNISGG